MASPKVGIVINARGVESVALMADDPDGRQEALRIYSAIQPAVDTFSLQVLERLVRDGAERKVRPCLRADPVATRDEADERRRARHF